MPEIIFGLLVGVVAGTRMGWPADQSLTLAAVCAALIYLCSCWCWPFRLCWWCAGASTKRSGPGRNYRRAADCLVCGGRDYRRFGARLVGRG